MIQNSFINRKSLTSNNINILCPKCKSVPLIKLAQPTSSEILIICKNCLKEEKESIQNILDLSSKFIFKFPSDETNIKNDSENLTKSCSECEYYYSKKIYHNEDYNHSLKNTKFNSKSACKIHNKPIYYLCKNCNKLICLLCNKESHFDHQIMPLNRIINDNKINEFNENLIKAKEKIKIKNSQIYEQSILKVKSQINNTNIKYQKMISDIISDKDRVNKELNAYMNKINEVYKWNTLINSNILQLIDIFVGLFNNTQEIINFNTIINIINNSNFNLNTININSCIIDDVMDYYKNDIIVSENNEIPSFTLKKEFIINADSSGLDSQFSVFKSIKNEYLLSYITEESFNISFFNIINEQIVHTIKNAHSKTIFCCKHYSDYIYLRDLIISTSEDKFVKIWDIYNNYQNILTIEMDSFYWADTANLLQDQTDNSLYLITPPHCGVPKIWDMKGKYINSFGDNLEYVKCSETYSSNNQNRIDYVIFPNYNNIKIYEFQTGDIFQILQGPTKTVRTSVKIGKINENVFLFESDKEGTLRIWNFNMGELVSNIYCNDVIYSMCLWSEDIIIIGCQDNLIKVVDFGNSACIKTINCHKGFVNTICKINHPSFGQCILTLGEDKSIKLWGSQ